MEDEKPMHPCRITKLEGSPFSFDVSVAWYQGNNVDLTLFFHKSHLRGARAKKGFSVFSPFIESCIVRS